MSHAKHASKRKRLRKAVPMVGIAGVSLAMAGGASLANAPTANVPSQDTAPGPVITLGEEEISDVSLATFYVFDKENAGAPQLGKNIQLAARGCGGCRGCGGRGCGGRGCGGAAAEHAAAEDGCGGCRGCGCSAGCGCIPCFSWGGCAPWC